MRFDSFHWLGAEADYDGCPLLIRLREFPKEFPTSKYPERLNITWTMSEVDENGLPTDKEFSRLAAFENLLVDSTNYFARSLKYSINDLDAG